jgi:ferritin-like protein
VAPDTETFADRVRDRYLFVLSGLSDAEREVVEESIDGAYFEDDEAFRSVVDRIREHDGISEDDFYGTWLLEYEGTEYLAYVEW